MGEYEDINIRFLCDPHQESINKALSLIKRSDKPVIYSDEKDLLEKVKEIDLLVIATPNYLHTPQLLRWAKHCISILVEKPVAISERQVLALKAMSPSFRANVWVAMEYRYIPAIQKLISLLPTIGQPKSITIRENRFPFLSKINEWNKDIDKSGDTLVEKCCHFFDLFRLISSAEMNTCSAKIHRGLLAEHYGYHERSDNPVPIIDGAYVLLDFLRTPEEKKEDGDIGLGADDLHLCESKVQDDASEIFGRRSGYHRTKTNVSEMQQATMGCLELCMFAEGSRHQEEIIVTGMKGRIEAYLPENKVFMYERPSRELWTDLSQPPPPSAIKETIIDCSDLNAVYPFADEIPQHSGHHYCSTAVEWKYLIDAIKDARSGKTFVPQVSLDDGIKAVEMGIRATANVSNRDESVDKVAPVIAFSTQSSENLLNLALEIAMEKKQFKKEELQRGIYLE